MTDFEAIAWAQATVVGRRPSAAERVRAYRVLAAWKPASFACQLAESLLEHSRHASSDRLALLQEAAAAARVLAPTTEPEFALVEQVLDAYQFALYQTGRRADGDAVCAELGVLARQGGGARRGLDTWARSLAEAGRHGEAADICGESASVGATEFSGSVWNFVQLAAQAWQAGRAEQAQAVLVELTDRQRAELAHDRGQERVLFHLLVYHAWLSRAGGRTDGARAVEHAALELMDGVVRAGGERKVWSNYQSTLWSTLLAASTATAERDHCAGPPYPAFGWHIVHWSPDLREAYCGGIDAIVTAAAAQTDPAVSARLRRLAAVRTAVRHEFRSGTQWAQQCWQTFDNSVSAARHLRGTGHPTGTATLAQALTDRAGLAAAAGRYEQALHDLAEAVHAN